MAFGVTHAFLSLLGTEFFKRQWNKAKAYVPKYYVLIALFAGILPDLDYVFIVLGNMLGVNVPTFLVHRTLTHSFFFFLIFIIPAFFFIKKHKKIAGTLFILGFGSLLHALTDYLFSHPSDAFPWLLPFSWKHFSFNLLPDFSLAFFIFLDLILLFSWFIYDARQNR